MAKPVDVPAYVVHADPPNFFARTAFYQSLYAFSRTPHFVIYELQPKQNERTAWTNAAEEFYALATDEQHRHLTFKNTFTFTDSNELWIQMIRNPMPWCIIQDVCNYIDSTGEQKAFYFTAVSGSCWILRIKNGIELHTPDGVVQFLVDNFSEFNLRTLSFGLQTSMDDFLRFTFDVKSFEEYKDYVTPSGRTFYGYFMLKKILEKIRNAPKI